MNDDKLNECKTVFDIFDKDKDGKIAKKELGDVIRILGTYPSKNDLEKINETLKSDLISYDVFLPIFKDIYSKKESEDDLINQFKQLDKENKGKINLTDLKNLMSKSDDVLNYNEIEEILKEDSVDSEGNIDYVKFIKTLLE